MEPPPPYNQHVRGIRSYSDVSVDSTLPIKHKKNPGDKEKSAAGVYSEVKDLDDEESPTEYTTAPFHELDGSKQGRIVAAQPSIFSRDSWLYEVLFLFLTMVVGVCLIAILARYNRKPNPLWIGGITLNTVVSIGSTLFRIFLFVPVATCTSQLAWVWFSKRQRPLSDIIIFDRASRTLSGSVQMLFSDVWRYVT